MNNLGIPRDKSIKNNRLNQEPHVDHSPILLLLEHREEDLSMQKRKWVFAIALALFIGSLAAQSGGVVAAAGITALLGSAGILGAWAIDNIAMLIAAAAYSLVTDRYSRIKLLIGSLIGFSILYAILYFLLPVTPFAYLGLMIVTDQQSLLIVLLVWALASDVFTIEDSKNIFGPLSVAALLGGLAGNALSGFLGGRGLTAPALLIAAVSLFVLAVIIAAARLTTTTRQASVTESPREQISKGLEFVREVPIYRHLALAMLAIGFCLCVTEYHILLTAASTNSGTAGIQEVYGLLRAGRIAALVVIQTLIASRLLKQMNFKKVFFIAPIACLGGIVAAIFVPGLVGAAIGQYAVRLSIDGIDDSARRSLIGLVPDKQRGRVGALLNGYPFSIGGIVGCLVLGLVLLVTNNPIVYLALAAVAAVYAIYHVYLLRKTYDASQLNWRMSRRSRSNTTRHSVLDQL
jgi:ATP:ADP antiporter, AAA family